VKKKDASYVSATKRFQCTRVFLYICDVIPVHKFLPSKGFEAGPSNAESSGIFSSQSAASKPPNHLDFSPFSRTILSPIKSTRNARKHNKKKQKDRHITSEENIGDSSEKRILKTERENIANE
jgi:hypothetical protein